MQRLTQQLQQQQSTSNFSSGGARRNHTTSIGAGAEDNDVLCSGCSCCCCGGRGRIMKKNNNNNNNNNRNSNKKWFFVYCTLLLLILIQMTRQLVLLLTTLLPTDAVAIDSSSIVGISPPVPVPPRPPYSTTSGNNNGLLLDLRTIQRSLLAEAPWAESHGADHNLYLGAGMLYYGYAYSHRAKTIVVLGSGGGYVPRLLRQAQRDLIAATGLPGRFYQLILIDAHLPEAGWGSTFYANNPASLMQQQFTDIEYVYLKTDEAYLQLKKRRLSIDYLHIDADHSYQQSLLDFQNYYTLMSPTGVISFHDTSCREAEETTTVAASASNSLEEQCHSGVPRTLQYIRSHYDTYQLQIIDMNYLYRGIAFAVRDRGSHPHHVNMDTTSYIDAPPNRRYNFCKNNAAKLQQQGPEGFTLNGRVGRLETLGDYYKCHQHYNMTELALITASGGTTECPFGLRRDQRMDCSKCIPGMKGNNCQQYRYENLRQRHNNSVQSSNQQQEDKKDATATLIPDRPTHVNNNNHTLQSLVSKWIVDYNVQHVLEWGTAIASTSAAGISRDKNEPISKRLLLLDDDNNHNNNNTVQSSSSSSLGALQSIITIDPLIESPKWTTITTPATTTRTTTSLHPHPINIRWLPCLFSDLLAPNGRYYNSTSLRREVSISDTLICWNCDRRLQYDDAETAAAAFKKLLQQSRSLKNIRFLILEGSATSTSTSTNSAPHDDNANINNNNNDEDNDNDDGSNKGKKKKKSALSTVDLITRTLLFNNNTNNDDDDDNWVEEINLTIKASATIRGGSTTTSGGGGNNVMVTDDNNNNNNNDDDQQQQQQQQQDNKERQIILLLKKSTSR